MNRLASRVRRLEQRMPDPSRPRIIPSPTDGMTEEKIEQEMVRRVDSGPMSEEEFCRMHGVKMAGR